MPLTLGLAGAGKAASALGGSGKAGPTSKSTIAGTNTGSSSSNGTNATNYTEAPGILNFQESLLPAVSSLYSQAQQPVYGAAQEAQVANQADAATTAGSQALTNKLARSGGLNSGANVAGQTALAQSNLGNLTNFFSQVPALNQQAELQNTGNVLNMAEGIVGRAPTNSSTTSNQTGSTGSVNNSTNEGFGPSFTSSLLGNTGNILSNAGGVSAASGGKGGGK